MHGNFSESLSSQAVWLEPKNSEFEPTCARVKELHTDSPYSRDTSEPNKRNCRHRAFSIVGELLNPSSTFVLAVDENGTGSSETNPTPGTFLTGRESRKAHALPHRLTGRCWWRLFSVCRTKQVHAL